MRFIIHEMAYEQPLTRGKWQYELDGQATGTVEEWRLSEALEGYRFLRVDLDARSAPSGRSTVYHLTLDEFGRAVQLKYRFWVTGLEIIGSVLLEEDAVIVTHETTDKRREEVVEVPAGYGFWFPSTSGLGLLANSGVCKERAAVTLRTAGDDPALFMSPVKTAVTVQEEAPVTVKLMGKQHKAKPVTINWADQQRKLWLGEDNWPLRMERDDGLTAVGVRNIKYQRITKPGGQ